MRTRLHLRRRDRSRGDLGTMDLADLSARAFSAIVERQDDDEVRVGAERLLRSLIASTLALADRTHAEFTAPTDWTVEQRQTHSLQAIVALVEAVKGILAAAGLGPEIQAAVTALLRETYFARLMDVARGGQAEPGQA